ncbi:MAG: carboxylate--amine ligase [Campylobacterales bacterium]|nr:carboxylate--amine ligase [Campylobacterales bacterium]
MQQKTKNQIEYQEGKYRYQQLMSEANLGLPKNLVVDFTKVDHWLENILKVDIEPYSATLSLGDNQEQNTVLQIMWRSLLLRKALFQAFNTPLFDTGDILSIDETKDKYQITAQISEVEHITQKVNNLVLKMSIHFITKFFHNEATTKNIQSLYDEIENKLIKPYKKMTGSGKSTMPILKAAHQKHIPFIHLSAGVYQLGWGANLKIIQASRIGEDSAIGASLSDNKFTASQIIREAGLPAPRHGLISTYSQALEIAKQLNFPLVTKPSDLNRGEGVSIVIYDESALKEGFEVAYKLSKAKQVIVEQQVEGVCCRILVANGKMYYAVDRFPKSVKGDGKKNVKRLIEEANKKNLALPPWQRKTPFPKDDLALESIQRAGFTLKSIPKEGELVPLRRIESTQWGGEAKDVTKTIHPDNIDIALRVAKLFGLRVAGVDIISPDITKPWYENGAIINEVNFSPAYGSSDISKVTIPYFLDDLINGDGRIPITVIAGDEEAMQKAKELQKEAINSGKRAFITSDKQTIDNQSKERIMPLQSLYRRIKALLMDRDVEVLIIVVHNDELLQTLLPINSIDDIIVVNDNIEKMNNGDESFKALVSLLKSVH